MAEIFQAVAATIALSTAFWKAWQNTKQFLDEAGRVDETFKRLDRRLERLKDAILYVAATVSTAPKPDRSTTLGQLEEAIYDRFAKNQQSCQRTLRDLTAVVEGIEKKESKMGINDFFDRVCKQMRAKKHGSTMSGLFTEIDEHMQGQQMFFLCLVRLGQAETNQLLTQLNQKLSGGESVDGQPLADSDQPSTDADSDEGAGLDTGASSAPLQKLESHIPGSLSPRDFLDQAIKYINLDLPRSEIDDVSLQLRSSIAKIAISLVKENRPYDLQQLLEKESSVLKFASEKYGTGLIHQAIKNHAANSDIAVLETLLDYLKKFTEEEQQEVIDSRDTVEQNTPLFVAIEQEWPQAVELLLSRGANVTLPKGNDINEVPLAFVGKRFMKDRADKDRQIIKTLFRHKATIPDGLDEKTRDFLEKMVSRRNSAPVQRKDSFPVNSRRSSSIYSFS